jgi:lipoyl synthase
MMLLLRSSQSRNSGSSMLSSLVVRRANLSRKRLQPQHQLNRNHSYGLLDTAASSNATPRFFSAQPDVAVVQVTQTSTKGRLENLRQQLATEQQTHSSATIDDFFIRPIRKKAPPRSSKILPKPAWLKAAPADSENYQRLRTTVRELGLATVCEEARCPNIGECWGGGKDQTATATIMILGDTCTRGCRFCSVKTSKTPPPPDPNEPTKVAQAIAAWGLDYVVLTSVDRDDLSDQGADHFAQVIRNIKMESQNGILVEALTPDFRGDHALVHQVATAGLDVYAHNMETVERLTPRVRDHRATYRQSLGVLEYVTSLIRSGNEDDDGLLCPKLTKTSLMLGLGETDDELRQTLVDLRTTGCSVVTFGQYLQPTKKHLAVQEYIPPEKFAFWQTEAEGMGFAYVASGPMVRSSYKAGEFFLKNLLRQQQPTSTPSNEAEAAV